MRIAIERWCSKVGGDCSISIATEMMPLKSSLVFVNTCMIESAVSLSSWDGDPKQCMRARFRGSMCGPSSGRQVFSRFTRASNARQKDTEWPQIDETWHNAGQRSMVNCESKLCSTKKWKPAPRARRSTGRRDAASPVLTACPRSLPRSFHTSFVFSSLIGSTSVESNSALQWNVNRSSSISECPPRLSCSKGSHRSVCQRSEDCRVPFDIVPVRSS